MMVIVNELVRPTLKGKPYHSHGVTAMNSAKANLDECSWICHNNTGYCKENHVKVLKDYFDYKLKYPSYIEGLNYIRDNFIRTLKACLPCYHPLAPGSLRATTDTASDSRSRPLPRRPTLTTA